MITLAAFAIRGIIVRLWRLGITGILLLFTVLLVASFNANGNSFLPVLIVGGLVAAFSRHRVILVPAIFLTYILTL